QQAGHLRGDVGQARLAALLELLAADRADREGHVLQVLLAQLRGDDDLVALSLRRFSRLVLRQGRRGRKRYTGAERDERCPATETGRKNSSVCHDVQSLPLTGAVGPVSSRTSTVAPCHIPSIGSER